MGSLCLLTAKEPILIPNCILLYLYSNNINHLKSLFLKEKKVIIIIVIKHTNKVSVSTVT